MLNIPNGTQESLLTCWNKCVLINFKNFPLPNLLNLSAVSHRYVCLLYIQVYKYDVLVYALNQSILYRIYMIYILVIGLHRLYILYRPTYLHFIGYCTYIFSVFHVITSTCISLFYLFIIFLTTMESMDHI